MQNPDSERRFVKAFSNSVQQGDVEDLLLIQQIKVGKNFSTLDSPWSYLGVDLCSDRKLIPTCYSIKQNLNGRSMLLSWRIEASNDLTNWVTLDDRTVDLHSRAVLEKLTKRGGVATLGIHPNVTKHCKDGWQVFRIV